MDVTLTDGQRLSIEDEPFNAGVDGSVHWSLDGTRLVKLYHEPEPWRAATLESILVQFNVVRNEPYWERLLCWPVGIVQKPRLGVVMPRAEANLKKIAALVTPAWLNYHPEDRGSFHGRVAVALNLARAVRRLHNRGLCHSDLSDNNVLANASDGRSYVIDCDGLVVPNKARPVVIGTKGTMAPELVSASSKDPTVATDLHSLAVLIYQLLLLRHPLIGAKVHDPNDPDRDETLQLGDGALYIEHPTDTTNRPQRLDWRADVLGSAMVRMTERALVAGLHDPPRRPLAAEWERELVRLSDTLVTCLNPECIFKSFPLPESARGAVSVACPWCKAPLRGFHLPVLHWVTPVPGQAGVYRFDGTRLAGWPDLTLHEWHVRPNLLPGPRIDGRPLARIVRDRGANGGDRWVLVNEQAPFLAAADPGQPWLRIRTREAVELRSHRKLRFGPDGEARDAIIDMLMLA